MTINLNVSYNLPLLLQVANEEGLKHAVLEKKGETKEGYCKARNKNENVLHPGELQSLHDAWSVNDLLRRGDVNINVQRG